MSLKSTVKNAITRSVVLHPATNRASGPMASFSFDDFPRSAWTAGGAILERHGAKATYYTAGRFCGLREDGLDYYTPEDLRAAHAAGHEIGCHTFSHQPSPTVGSKALEADLARNQAFVSELLGPDGSEMSTFAYPYGHVSLRTKRLAGRRYEASRGYRWGVNRRRLDRGELLAVHLEARSWNAPDIEARIGAARDARGWLVFVTHDVSDAPSPYGATPAMLEHALGAVRSAGFEILTVRDAMNRAMGA